MIIHYFVRLLLVYLAAIISDPTSVDKIAFSNLVKVQKSISELAEQINDSAVGSDVAQLYKLLDFLESDLELWHGFKATGRLNTSVVNGKDMRQIIRDICDNNRIDAVRVKEKVIVIIIFDSSCAISKLYKSRIVELIRNSKKESHYLLIDIKNGAWNWPENNNYTLITKEKSKILADLGVVYTPASFVISSSNTLSYTGAIDDRTNIKSVKHSYLKDAIEKVVDGNNPTIIETPQRGSIRLK